MKDGLRRVSLRDDELCNIIRKGDVTISLSNSLTLKLNDIMNVLKLKRNLISIGQLADEGMKTNFDSDICKITKDDMVMAHGKKKGTLYMMSGSGASISGSTSELDAEV